MRVNSIASDQNRKFLIIRDTLSNGVDVLTTDLAIATYSWTAVAQVQTLSPLVRRLAEEIRPP